MRLEKIVTLANKAVYLRFTAMERSLRATGCNLPLLVIPYNDQLFQLPPNASWLKDEHLYTWLEAKGLSGLFRKYICFTQSNYLFVDTDIIFLRNPIAALASVNGFITSCGHWHNTNHTVSAESKAILMEKSTNWQSKVFNSGQFACDKVLYKTDKLYATLEMPMIVGTALNNALHDQAGINLLVNITDIPIVNLTLPPYNMESTWAGDYPMDDYGKYWKNEEVKPFLIHWAGRSNKLINKIDNLFFEFLSAEERALWKPVQKKRINLLKGAEKKLRKMLNGWNK